MRTTEWAICIYLSMYIYIYLYDGPTLRMLLSDLCFYKVAKQCKR